MICLLAPLKPVGSSFVSHHRFYVPVLWKYINWSYMAWSKEALMPPNKTICIPMSMCTTKENSEKVPLSCFRSSILAGNRLEH